MAIGKRQDKESKMLTKNDLQKFCATYDGTGRSIDKPWSRNVYTFATNGHVVIRIKRLDDVPENPKAPGTFNLWPKRIPPFVEIPDLPEQEFESCKECGGAGKISICPECDGDCVVTFKNKYNEYECDCESCGGSGKAKGHDQICDECDGSGNFPLIKTIKVGNCFFSNHYLALIKELPGLKFAPHETDQIAAAYFSFDDGDGLLMPIRP
jgi:hypothetical protein